MFNKKILAIILTLLMLSFMLCACALHSGSDSAEKAQVTATEDAALTPTETPSPKITEEPEITPTPEVTLEPTVTPEPKSSANTQISEDWTDCQFSFDGTTYTLPHLYSDFAAAGWTFDLADYGYDGGYTMNKGDMTYSTINLENSTYNEQLSVSVGFINTKENAADITECSVWAFECDSRYGFEPLNNVPDIMLSKGITWGSSQDDVIAAYGEPDEIYDAVADCGYKVFSYENDSIYLKLNIYVDGGVSSVSFQNYI